MAEITIPGMFLTGDHASRPAATAVGGGSIYSCTDHDLLYQSDGAAWTTWATLSGGAPDAHSTSHENGGSDELDVTGLAGAGGGGNTGTLYRVDYVAYTSSTNVSQTAEGSADTIVTANGVAFDGSTIARIDFFVPRARPAASAGANLEFVLYDGASSIGLLGRIFSAAATSANVAVKLEHYLTPSNATHTYSIRAIVSTGTGVVAGGAGGSGAIMPGFIAIYKLV